MPIKEAGDPRLQALFGASDSREGSARPTVTLPRKGVPPLVVGGAIFLFAVLLFSILNARRLAQPQPLAEASARDNGSAWAPPPPLYVPPEPAPAYLPAPIVTANPPVQVSVNTPPIAAPTRTNMIATPPTIVQQAPQTIPQSMLLPPQPQQRLATGPALVFDGGSSPQNDAPAQKSTSGDPDSKGIQGVVRVRASALANRSMTVPQGYLIPAVLETGFDSTKPGFARAIVSPDVRGFDGKNVLIPRGSRLTGEYQGTVAQGQNRAVIIWSRLIRPDGMTIAMEAPAVDTVGRGGVKASVNTHFFARLGDALLQSTVQLGQAIAGRSVTGPVVVLQGNATAAASQALVPSASYTPTLRVPPGRSISIFVAQDLDFSSASPAR